MQEQLEKEGESIKVTSQTFISYEEYKKYFVYKLYECYKPTNLNQTREYLDYITSPNHEGKQLSKDLDDYLNTELETRIPNIYNQERLL